MDPSVKQMEWTPGKLQRVNRCWKQGKKSERDLEEELLTKTYLFQSAGLSNTHLPVLSFSLADFKARGTAVSAQVLISVGKASNFEPSAGS